GVARPHHDQTTDPRHGCESGAVAAAQPERPAARSFRARRTVFPDVPALNRTGTQPGPRAVIEGASGVAVPAAATADLNLVLGASGSVQFRPSHHPADTSGVVR